MENFKAVAQTLLEQTAHFVFCPPQIGFFGGPGGVPEILFSLESKYFCYLGAPAKFQNCSTNPSADMQKTFIKITKLRNIWDDFPHKLLKTPANIHN